MANAAIELFKINENKLYETVMKWKTCLAPGISEVLTFLFKKGGEMGKVLEKSFLNGSSNRRVN